VADRPKVSEKEVREQRLHAALRENLKRRKAQARGRADTRQTAEPHDSAGIVPEKDSG
jgi:hypothetical protein